MQRYRTRLCFGSVLLSTMLCVGVDAQDPDSSRSRDGRRDAARRDRERPRQDGAPGGPVNAVDGAATPDGPGRPEGRGGRGGGRPEGRGGRGGGR